jgi:hypothetical protein
VSITQERHAAAIAAVLLENSLSLDEQNVINILRNMMNKSSITKDVFIDEKSITIKKNANLISDNVINVVESNSSNDEDMGEIIGAVIESDLYSTPTHGNNNTLNNNNILNYNNTLNNNNTNLNNNENMKKKRKNELISNKIETDSIVQSSKDKIKLIKKNLIKSKINSSEDLIMEKEIKTKAFNDDNTITSKVKTKDEFNMKSVIKNNKIIKEFETIDKTSISMTTSELEKKKKIKKKYKKSSDEIDNIFGNFL